jgi:Undecaprenyl-phosphate glucose phosphotransferase
MKALPRTAIRRSDTSGLVPGRLRPGYADFALFAILSDTVAVVLASVAAGGIYHWIAFGRVASLNDFFGLGLILAALTVVLIKLKGLYAPDSLLSVRSQIAPVIVSWSSVLLLLLGASFTMKISDSLSRGWALSFAIAAPSLILFQRSLLRRAMVSVLESGLLKRNKIVLITGDATSMPAVDDTLRPYEVVGIYVVPRDANDTRSLFQDLVRTLRGSDISEIHVAIEWDRWPGIRPALLELRELPFPVRLLADATAREILQSPERKLCGAVSFELQRAPLTSGERAAKRAFDIVGAACGLLILAPLLLLISLAVWFDSPGPIIFRQRRGGFNGRSFHILKFRTMHVAEDGPVITQAARHDDRVTRVGRWLRRTSADELPQLINVLRGDMSLVGPRPHAQAHDDWYSALISIYPCRHHVKPGITGWAQIHGLRGETPTLSLMQRRVELDLWYVRNWSFWLDLRILIQTVGEAVRARNAY